MPVHLAADGHPRTLHVLAGAVRVLAADGAVLAQLGRGQSALLPAALGPVQLSAGSPEGTPGAHGAHGDAAAGRILAEAVLVEVPAARVSAAAGAVTTGAGERAAGPRPAFLAREPVELRFGTSGLRGLVRDMTDLEVYINTRGFLRFVLRIGEAAPGTPVGVAEDLREFDPTTGLVSSPRIARAVARAIHDEGFTVRACGRIPTPALAYHAGRAAADAPFAAVMVTGSHIPADRNGIKFYRPGREVLKGDEPGILTCVAEVRRQEYRRPAGESPFDATGMFRIPGEQLTADPAAAEQYLRRYLDAFAGAEGRAPELPLSGWRIVLFEHTAVGRGLLREILAGLGAEVVPVERSDTFVPVDTEDVSPVAESRYLELVTHHAAHALVSTDGDGDRPLLVDERGRFHRGDVVGLVTAELLDADFCAVPVSASDALDRRFEQRAAAGRTRPVLRKTRIGSPHVIAALEEAVAQGYRRVVGWEANGGFLTATDLTVGEAERGERLAALPTRDAVLPLVAVLLAAARSGRTVSELFAELPQRATRSGLLDGFPTESSRALLERLAPGSEQRLRAVRYGAGGEVTVTAATGDEERTLEPRSGPARDLHARRELLERYFGRAHGYGPVLRLDLLDGIRIEFAGGDIVHLRPSGNAPQLRVYAVADRQARADAMVAAALSEPGGILRRMERDLLG
ncbi:MAG: hypothetical protein R6X25_12180 [Candidatus Krumholzibacteriia bacterium]